MAPAAPEQNVDLLSASQYFFVYNAFSFTLACMAATTLFLWFARSQVAPAYRTALTISGLVTAIAAYHYWRIFESWDSAYDVIDGTVTVTGLAFNDAYRYVDWLLTVPLLLIELVLVMKLSRSETVSKSWKLGIAAALMIILGYPGEISDTIQERAIWGALSTIPFLYIVWELFKGLGESIERQPVEVRKLIKDARLVTFASWGFYPIVYMAPFVGAGGGSVETALQVGYTIADIIAKCGVGILIYVIAARKSEFEPGWGAKAGTAPAT
ncbi:bacteriorhodopsin-like [Aurantiacibacter aquimixticola]|uniref:Xanthorhodopsin n=1 Tax=Aurantiacibacter aquimixticola TaxID=1958945 RepID=A0A419RUB5_9SPHN|nr:bacteriorhodopsin-like [Aurantiacibacter aquimixticola]RJY09376.1 xanthorhodopsin [Aurantiacibacter aquimixticola]